MIRCDAAATHLVSSASTAEALRRTLSARSVMSSKLPSGVLTTYKPGSRGSSSSGPPARLGRACTPPLVVGASPASLPPSSLASSKTRARCDAGHWPPSLDVEACLARLLNLLQRSKCLTSAHLACNMCRMGCSRTQPVSVISETRSASNHRIQLEPTAFNWSKDWSMNNCNCMLRVARLSTQGDVVLVPPPRHCHAPSGCPSGDLITHGQSSLPQAQHPPSPSISHCARLWPGSSPARTVAT